MSMKWLLLLLCPSILQAQIIYTGEVLNIKDNSSIPYASIGLLKENRGINANEEGRFILSSNSNHPDTLIISSTGFETLKISTENFPASHHFFLKEKITELKNIIIRKTYEVKKISEFSGCGNAFYTSSGYISEVAKHFSTPVKNVVLDKIEICKSAENAIFRVKVYSMDSVNKMPLVELNDQIIEVKSLRRNVNINLSDYHIIIPDKDFFIAVEWLKIPYNHSEETVKINGVKTISARYSPLLSFPAEKSDSSNTTETLDIIWQKNYNGKWFPINWKKSDLLISVTVRY